MTTEQVLVLARRAADEVRAGRRAVLPPMTPHDSRRVTAAVRRILSGWDPADIPD